MAFWSGETLKERARICFQGDYNSNNVDCAAYTLHVGNEVYITPDQYDSHPSKSTKKFLSAGEPFNIPSGQFAFLLTDEIVTIPDACLAFISIKAKTKFKGLVNISGFHVDPGYKGRLIFSVFNAGPSTIRLSQGMPLFLMWMADLDNKTEIKKNGVSNTELNLDLISHVDGAIFSPQSISQSVKDFKAELEKQFNEETLRFTRELSSHRDSISKSLSRIWYVLGGTATVVILLLAPTLKLLYSDSQEKKPSPTQLHQPQAQP